MILGFLVRRLRLATIGLLRGSLGRNASVSHLKSFVRTVCSYRITATLVRLLALLTLLALVAMEIVPQNLEGVFEKASSSVPHDTPLALFILAIGQGILSFRHALEVLATMRARQHTAGETQRSSAQRRRNSQARSADQLSFLVRRLAATNSLTAGPRIDCRNSWPGAL